MSEWQTIETAPKDGTVVDLWMPADFGDPGYRVANCSWREEKPPFDEISSFGWFREHDEFGWIDVWVPNEDMSAPTHWMPMPAPPAP